MHEAAAALANNPDFSSLSASQAEALLARGEAHLPHGRDAHPRGYRGFLDDFLVRG